MGQLANLPTARAYPAILDVIRLPTFVEGHARHYIGPAQQFCSDVSALLRGHSRSAGRYHIFQRLANLSAANFSGTSANFAAFTAYVSVVDSARNLGGSDECN